MSRIHFVLLLAALCVGVAFAQEQPATQTPDSQQQTQTAPPPNGEAKPQVEPQPGESHTPPQAEQPQSPQAEQCQRPQAEQPSKQAPPKQSQVEGKKGKPPATKPQATKQGRKKATAPRSTVLKHKKTRRHATKKSTKATEPKSSATPDKVVVRNGGAKDTSVEIAPQLSREQAQQKRDSAALLISKTEGNLKALASRQLSKAQQDTVEQIHAYLRQAKAASSSGDVARANTLAFKAHLLSDDLLKN